MTMEQYTSCVSEMQPVRMKWCSRLCAAKKLKEFSTFMSYATLACFVCRPVSCIHRKQPHWKQIFPDSWFGAKPSWKRLSAAAAWTQRRKKEWWERAALKLIPLILWGVGVFPSLVSLFMTTYFFSLLLIFFFFFFILRKWGSCFPAKQCLVF